MSIFNTKWFNAEEQKEWNEIILKLNKYLNRDVRSELATKTLLEFIDLYKKQQEYTEKLEQKIEQLADVIKQMNNNLEWKIEQVERYEKAIKEAIGECRLDHSPFRIAEMLEDALDDRK